MGEFQESVISAVLKLCLKSLQEFVRLQTFNRSGFQQIQLDMEFLKTSLKEFVDDEAAISFLLKEVRYSYLLAIDFFYRCFKTIFSSFICSFLYTPPVGVEAEFYKFPLSGKKRTGRVFSLLCTHNIWIEF